MRLIARGEHRAQVLRRHRRYLGAGDRIAGDAAAKVAHVAVGIAASLAEEVDAGEDLAALVGAHGAHVGDQPVRPDDHLHLASDLAGHGDRRVGMRLELGELLRIHADLRARPGDLEHLADRGQGFGGTLGRRGRRLVVAEAVHLIEELAQVGLVVHGREFSG